MQLLSTQNFFEEKLEDEVKTIQKWVNEQQLCSPVPLPQH